MQTVLVTHVFERQARSLGLSEDEFQDVVAVVAADPQSGDLMAGTAGAGKLRHARQGAGKSGGYRTIHNF